ncbi:peroxiredoxin [Abyssibius alkaniclasticus]|uniref:peroxiredoxin n=1 Tax=Abyssibius alkaniclasticus TaxID=2881234 RepID=UPI002363538E|nr:peroxiredoxin [Abyssibius alkaniclasticus]UPH72332.1 peroxiredoxin [Abyssibius alkaniclasticus]
MTIQPGDKLPSATFLQIGAAGPEPVASADVFKGKRVALFGLPGAYTGTCSTLHVPSFMRVAPALRDAGVDAIVCVSVNDPFVMKAWGEATGGADAGLTFLADADGGFIKSIGLDFTAPPSGLIGRSQRFAALVDDGEVKILNVEPSAGECNLSAGETLLAQMAA